MAASGGLYEQDGTIRVTIVTTGADGRTGLYAADGSIRVTIVS